MSINAHVGIIIGTMFTMAGASYSTVKGSEFISYHLNSYIPIVMAGVIAIYGLIVTTIAIVNLDTIDTPDRILSACLVSGFCNLFSGLAMGSISAKTNDINRGLIIALIFSESIGLYGLIMALIILKQ